MSPKQTLPFKKAGMVIHGKNAKGEHALVAPYTQGRFYDEDALVQFADWQGDHADDRTKYYVLPKGGIDKGEDVLDAAIRETHEETGIDVRRLLGAAAIERLKRGETVTDLQSPGYPGVQVVRADAQPIDHRYESRAGITRRMALFNIELASLEPLEPFLKNYEQRDQPSPGMVKTHPKVQQSIEQIMHAKALSERNQPPSLDDCLQWLRHGAIPPDGFNIGSNQSPLRDARHRDQYRMLVGEDRFVAQAPEAPLWFARLEQQFAPHGTIASRADWKKFCDTIPGEDYKELRQAFDRIKHYIKGRGFIGDDQSIIKLDDKDSPLSYYVEGADIVSFERFIGHGLAAALFNKDYAQAIFGGHGDVKSIARPEVFARSQFAAICPFSRPRDLDRGCERFRRQASEHLPVLKWASAIHSAKALPTVVDFKPALHAVRNHYLSHMPAEWGGRLGARPEPQLGSFGR